MIRSGAGAAPLTVLTPIRAGAEHELTAYLQNIPPGAGSPFHRLPGTHFARWVVVDRRPRDYSGAPVPPSSLRSSYLLFTSIFDSTVAEHVEELRIRLGVEADEVWGCCVGYPGRRQQRRFRKYLEHNRIREDIWHRAYDATVPQIRAALDLRRRHIEFALRAQGLDDRQLHQAFLDEFGG